MVGEGVQGELGLGLKVRTGNTAALESEESIVVQCWTTAKLPTPTLPSQGLEA